jgi:hypothetical protein
MSIQITASMLYNLVQCPKRVDLDLFGDPALRDEIILDYNEDDCRATRVLLDGIRALVDH